LQYAQGEVDVFMCGFVFFGRQNGCGNGSIYLSLFKIIVMNLLMLLVLNAIVFLVGANGFGIRVDSHLRFFFVLVYVACP
jgi:hypothetical protein